jgi:hypothetical protein
MPSVARKLPLLRLDHYLDVSICEEIVSVEFSASDASRNHVLVIFSTSGITLRYPDPGHVTAGAGIFSKLPSYSGTIPASCMQPPLSGDTTGIF